MAELVVVTGPPGAGKSTVAALLVDRFTPSALVTGDTFFAFLARGALPPWLPEAHAQNTVVVDAAAAATGRFVAGGLHVVYDGVVGPWFVDRLAAEVPDLHYVVLLPPLATCLERVATRTGHGFTDADAARRMHREFANADVAARHLVTGATADAAAVVDEIEDRLRDGSLRLRDG
ncbi:AAA family ATPase [Cellulomonas telluris]|uniref:AAA family ATPase n=1 Tax=Cellulomonas telluris TaxID=2306636 RepID=UPI0010A7D152|nr:AAA family ATPase [Cellulomonas telluris]